MVLIVDFGATGKGLALVAPSDQGTECAVGERNAVETAVQQSIRDAGLLLHAIGERHIGRVHAADVENEIGLEREHDFEIGGIATSGDAAHFRPCADVGQEEFAFLRAVGARPSNKKLGRERVEKDRRWWSGGKHALDPLRHRHGTAGAIGDGGGAGGARGEDRGRESGDQCAAVQGHTV